MKGTLFLILRRKTKMVLQQHPEYRSTMKDLLTKTFSQVPAPLLSRYRRSVQPSTSLGWKTADRLPVGVRQTRKVARPTRRLHPPPPLAHLRPRLRRDLRRLHLRNLRRLHLGNLRRLH